MSLFGILSARPEIDGIAGDGTELVRLINERISPPVPVKPEDIHARMLRLISDEVNDHGGRFPRDEHERLCELLIDTPVLIGHDRTRLPVARNFAARLASDPDTKRQWVEVWFYWRKGLGPHGDQLAADIDAGVIKEGSIGFEFRLPRCSICGRDIRACEHIPGRVYPDASGAEQSAHYEYRDIVRVLETSLVYRGATPGTHFVHHALFRKSAPGGSSEQAAPIQAVVLGCEPGGDRGYRYLAARRDPNDVTACDEFVFHSSSVFHIGDRLIRKEGAWRRRMDNIGRAAGELWRDCRSGLSSLHRPCGVKPPSVGCRLRVHARRPSACPRLILLYGAGRQVHRSRAAS